MITDPRTLRSIDWAISDFLRASRTDPDALVRALRHQGLSLVVDPDSDEDLTLTEEQVNEVVRATLNEAEARIREITPIEGLDVETREHFTALWLDEVLSALEDVWSDGE